MASARLSRRVEKVVPYPPLSEMSALQRRKFHEALLEAFEDIRWEPEEILDFGGTFLVTTRQMGRGSGSGVAVSGPVFQLFTVRRGLVVRQEDFLDRPKALEAVGLSE